MTYSPYAAAGTLVVPVAANQPDGSCWTTSITVPAPHVYRCLIAAGPGGTIADPCFAAADTASVVVCAADPWTPATLVQPAGTTLTTARVAVAWWGPAMP